MLPDSTSALLLLSVLLVHSSVLSCLIGTQRQCDVARFVPGYNMVGKGFDIVTLQRKRAHVIDVKTYLNARETCILCSNPLQNHAYQKLPLSVVDWSASSQCSADIISSYHTSVSSLIKAYTSQDTNDWTSGLEIEKVLFDNFDVGGTGSNAYKFASQQIEEDRYTFSTHSVTCNHYKFILSPTPPLSVEFKKQLDILPSHYNYSTENEYRKLIQTYGTHYFRLVDLGGRLRRLISSRSCLSTLNGLTSPEIHSCLSMGVAVGLGKLKISHVPKSCMGVLLNQDSATNFSSGLHRYYSEVSGGDGWLGEFSISKSHSTAHMNWLKSLIGYPEVVSFSLRPLYQLVPNKLQQAGVKTAIEQYLEDTSVKKSPQEPDCEGSTLNMSYNCCPMHASRGNLSVTIVRGWNLYGDVIGKTDGYAKMYYGSISHQTQVIVSDDPQWNAEFDLGKVDTSLALKIEVWDEDPKYDDLLIECEKYLIPGTHTFTCKSALGNVEVKYTLTCDPHLTGEKCSLYKPTP
ncbi:perforin-1-like [Xiphophorus couchianus]|uniref:perforin-1-like n=1 Tax=Xiphophorus couchianus TaxID=32473 RepID=UPI001016DE1C|nr:perforin-1-like [Xiphophorus couchianus]